MTPERIRPGEDRPYVAVDGTLRFGVSYFERGTLRGDAMLRLALGALGLVELLWPRRTVDFWMGLAAAGDQDVELRPWVYAAARVEGVLILLWVLGTAGRE